MTTNETLIGVAAVITAAMPGFLSWMQSQKISKTTEMTHELVNSASLIQLRLYAVAARRIADIPNASAEDIAAAIAAEKLVLEHEFKQKKADRIHNES